MGGGLIRPPRSVAGSLKEVGDMSNNQDLKFHCLFIIALMFVFVSVGCLIRTHSVVVERPDQEIEGNRGYIEGISSETKKREKKTRTTYIAEVEIGESVLIDDEASVKEDVLHSNTTIFEASEKKVVSQKEEPVKKDVKASSVSVLKEDKIKKAKTYVVKDGDTLEKISARPEIYGNKNKWYRIFKANENQLKEPDKIFPGQVLRIPE